MSVSKVSEPLAPTDLPSLHTVMLAAQYGDYHCHAVPRISWDTSPGTDSPWAHLPEPMSPGQKATAIARWGCRWEEWEGPGCHEEKDQQ